MLSHVFRLPAAYIQPLHAPSEFYDALLRGISNAQRRVVLASLYVGTGTLEQQLVQTLVERTRVQPLDVLLQLDACRSLRDVRVAATSTERQSSTSSSSSNAFHSSAAMLSHAMQRVAAPSRMRVGLTSMPATRSWLAQRMPDRYREGAGVFHMKAYVVDDDVIMSGANLSADYFTNRQDRYVLLRGVPQLADYLHELTQALYAVPGSHYIRRDGGGVAVHGSSVTEGHVRGGMRVQAMTSRDTLEFNAHLRQVLMQYSNAAVEPGPEPGADECVVVPRLQAGGSPLAVTHDSDATLAVLRGIGPSPRALPAAAHCDVTHMATGYFNLPASYADALIHEAHPASCIHVLTAAPQANGFFNGSSISAGVPMAYSEIERWFMERAVAAGRAHLAPASQPTAPGIAMHEYMRHGWTFHGKGLWRLRQSGDGGREMMTLLGSSNFGRRSVERDLELTLTLRTRDASLITRLEAERDALWRGAPDGDKSLVTAVGPHFPPITPEGINVWTQRSRSIYYGGGYSNGLWVHPATRVLMPFF